MASSTDEGLRIEVTAAHLTQGVPLHRTADPLGLALAEATGEPWIVLMNCAYPQRMSAQAAVWWFPRDIQEWMWSLNGGDPGEPFTFHLPWRFVPAALRRTSP